MTYNHELLHCNNVDTLKSMYYKYAKVLHPDHGGSKEDFQALQADYDYMFNKVKNIHVSKDGGTYEKATKEAPADFKNIIDNLINIPGLHIDIVGCFIWIGGNTYDCKDTLKLLGFKWSMSKRLWYKSPDGYKKASRKQYTYDDIINKYGVQSSINTGKKSRRSLLHS